MLAASLSQRRLLNRAADLGQFRESVSRAGSLHFVAQHAQRFEIPVGQRLADKSATSLRRFSR